MENLDFCDKHNMVAYLQKSEGSEGFHQIIDFLTTSHISTLENGDMEITATIDGKVKVVSEASIRRHLKLEDSNAKVATMPHDSPLPRVHSLGSDKGSMTLNELTILCTTLSKKMSAQTQGMIEHDFEEPDISTANVPISTTDAEVSTWNGYLRKRRKTKPKRQNRTQNGKDCERQSQIEAEKSIKSKSQQKSQLVKVKVNTDMVKSKESQRRKKYNYRD
ncbi:hypothetical protein Tco_0321285 [Tanacetum coccineum]